MWPLTSISALLIVTSLCQVTSHQEHDNPENFPIYNNYLSSFAEIVINSTFVSSGKKRDDLQIPGVLIHRQAVLSSRANFYGQLRRPKIAAITVYIQDDPYNVSKVITGNGRMNYHHTIIFLSTPVILTENIKIFPLAKADDTFVGSDCLEIVHQHRFDLFHIEIRQVKVVPNLECNKAYRLLSLAKFDDTTELCVENNSTRERPSTRSQISDMHILVCPSKDDPSLYVLASSYTSLKNNDEKNNRFGGFKSITRDRPWIDRMIGKLNNGFAISARRKNLDDYKEKQVDSLQGGTLQIASSLLTTHHTHNLYCLSDSKSNLSSIS